MLLDLANCLNIELVKAVPWSEVMCIGKPYTATHLSMKVEIIDFEVGRRIGTAIGILVYLSTIVKMYFILPGAVGRGPTISMWTWSNLALGSGKCCTDGFSCRCTLAFWHARHAFTISLIVLSMFWKMKDLAICAFVCFAPAWSMPWIFSNINLTIILGRKILGGFPVSQNSLIPSDVCNVTLCGDFLRKPLMNSSPACASATRFKESISIVAVNELTDLLSQSAITLYLPGKCWMLSVNSLINYRCRCCIAETGVTFLCRPGTKGSWSVKTVKLFPST